ncbi:unnamed protein product [Porites lobata]|uniref:Uncharacterized protein n=1 Tax=Porites lobata TaxID=104759 RepID=A0ABN8RKI9_9CNID|nr:unnamed protein product [Porites lobata]
MTSLLTDTIHSHLNLKVGDQGLTIPLPSSSKRPKITSIDRWLDAFAIYSAVIVSVYPSRAAYLIAYQQLIRDAARKFPGMACGGNGTSSSTAIPSQGSPNRDADLAAALIIFLIPALYLLVGPGMPLPNPTCATTLTKADPVLAPHALTNTGLWQFLPSTLLTTSPNCELTPPTPIDVNKFASYLQGHPDHTTVNHLPQGFLRALRLAIQVQGPPRNILTFPVQISTHLLLTKTC